METDGELYFLKKRISELENELRETKSKLKKDVMKNTQIEQSYKVSEGFFRGVFENAAIAMTLTDVNGKWIRVNRSMCEMTGYNEEELLTKNFQDITHPEDLEEDVSNYQNLLKGKMETYHMEKRYIHKQGYVVWTVLSASIVRDSGGEPLYFICERQDITKLKLAKEALYYDKLKTEFFANISHELRTPINIILSTIQLFDMYLKNEQLQGNIDNVRSYLITMKQNCYRTIRLVDNLIDTTRIDANVYNLNLKNHNIVQIVEDITQSVAQYVNDKGRKIIFDTDVEEKIISCDPDKMERVILNLISNAVKFTEKDGIIEVYIKDKLKYVEIYVKDNGIGIKEDKQSIIFERFGQADRSFVRNREGSGLGLSLVKSFIDMHGGKIEVRSEYGYGSEFIVKIPTQVIQEDLQNYYETEVGKSEILDKYIEKVSVEFSDIYF